MNKISKLLITLVIAGAMVLSFVAGIIFHANFSTQGQGGFLVRNLPFLEAGNQAAPPINAEETSADFEVFWEAWSLLNEKFYGEFPTDSSRVYGAIRGMVRSFNDPHTAFIDPTRAAVLSEDMSGSFEGIGAAIRLDEAGRLIIVDPFPDRPAFEAGLRPGDIILAVDDQPVEDLSLYEAVLLIRGPAGSTVTLTILREDQLRPIEVPVVRAKIDIEIVQSEILDPPGNIGYIQLTQFSEGASDKIMEDAEALLDQGAEALILDLRSNPGGLLSEAINVSSLFIEEGPVVIEKLKEGEEREFEARNGRRLPADIPLVILVNGGSASASEIVAGAIQDYERGTVLGEQTFGKGSVQLPQTLSDGSELRVTIAEWLTPAGRQIHGEGITPGVVVEMTIEDLEQDIDPQLDEAVKLLGIAINPTADTPE